MPDDGSTGGSEFRLSQLFDTKRVVSSDEEMSCCSVGSSCIGSLHDISEFIDTIADSWKQYLNNGDENVYDLMNDRALFKVPATLVPKTDMELLFEERDAEEVLVNLGFAYQESSGIPHRFIQHEQQKTGRKFKITDLDGHFNAAVQEGKIPERYLEGDVKIRTKPRDTSPTEET